MRDGINIEQVKAYNKSVKEYRDQVAKIQATVEFNQNELNRLCGELSQAIGKPVTADNIEQIYEEYVAKINNTLEVGNDIIKRIQSEEAAMNETPTNTYTAQQVAQPVAQPVPPVQRVPPPVAPPVAPQVTAPVAPPVAPVAPVATTADPAATVLPKAPIFNGSIFGSNGQLNPNNGIEI